MKLKKINKVLFLTLLVFSVCILNSYPETGAKYIIDNIGDGHFSLNFGVSTLQMNYGSEGLDYSFSGSSNYKTLGLKYKISRSNLFRSTDNKDVYHIVVPEDCTITNITSLNYSSKSNSQNEATITYNNVGSETISVSYTCPLEDVVSNDKVVSKINVYEQIKNEQSSEHLYLSGTFSFALSTYENMYPRPTGSISEDKKTYTLPTDSENKYNNFISWLTDYASVYANTEELTKNIIDYVKTVYNNESSILSTSLSLDGLNVSYNSSDDEYVYTATDNLLGYALNYKHINGIPNQFYYVSDVDDLSNIVISYLTKYQSFNNYTNDDINAIIDYINYKGGVSSDVAGITITDNTYYKKIYIAPSLLTAAQIYASGEIEIGIGTISQMWDLFISSINDVFADIISQTLVTTIQNSDVSIYLSVTKNSTNTMVTPGANNDYFFRYDSDKGWFVLINVSSDGTVTHATVDKIDFVRLDSGEDISYDNTNGTITIKLISGTDIKNRVQTLISIIDSKFSKSYSLDYSEDLIDSTPFTNGTISSTFDGEYYIFTLN